jgi:NOL1/NOP2/sun family putative RNA methylase
MSGRQFFIDRYESLGWEYKDVEPRQAIRINTMNTEEKDLLKRLESRGMKIEKVPFLQNGYWVKSGFSAGATSEYLLGLYSIQEAAAQIPPTLFSDVKNKVVLDACAAPGGKTIQLADLMQNTGAIIALDVEKSRLIAMANQLERCRVKNTVAYELDARQISKEKIRFDRILLDVPCSGNFAADKQWFRRRNIKDVERNAKVQREILECATKVLRDRGEIVYATCSLEPEEDELNIDWAIKNLGLLVEEIDCYGENGLTNVFGNQLDISVGKCRRMWPGETQGFFVCKLVKKVNG